MFKLLYILIYNQFKPPFTTYNYFYAFRDGTLMTVHSDK